jgi:hypothetical protein
VSIAVPPGAAVGEPATWMLLALALGLFAWTGTRPRPRDLVPSV